MVSAIDQWYTAVSVTIPMVVSDIHFQKTTSESLTCDLTFCFASISNIWSVRPAAQRYQHTRDPWRRERRLPFSARIFLCGCMTAESAVIGLRSTWLASDKSIMTTWFCSLTFSRTHM